MMQLIDSGYKSALAFSKSHYENFPVISFLLPKDLKKHIAVIYQFARQADDIADEGDEKPEERLIKLNDYENSFNAALKGDTDDAFWLALQNTISEKKLTSHYFTDLLKAFKQDAVKCRYDNYKDLLAYCSYSANPVGRLVLELNGICGEKIFEYSDAICTALQLTNFCQDVSLDFRKGRIYFPQSELKKFNVSEKDFELKKNTHNFKSLIKYQVIRNKEFFLEGYKLLSHLPNMLKYEILWTIFGGEKILEKIIKIDYNVLNIRPVLSKFDYFQLALKAIFKRNV